MKFAPVARRVARSLVRRGLRSARLRDVVEAELACATKPTATPLPPPAMPAVFTDRHGVDHALDPGLRDRLKPAWRTMCDPVAASLPPTDEVLGGKARKAAKSATEMERLLGATSGVSVAGRILEIGCFDGAAAFELSKRPGASVVGSDLARYYMTQRPGRPADGALAEEQERLAELRERAREIAGVAPGRVSFVEDDITASALEPGTFDLICSFEVLEHLLRPPDAFAMMATLLRPGGHVYGDYNPFFSAIGGHSLGTLDVPWGHARFAPDDLAKYLREIRPSEVEQAQRFLDESLNRMTLADLQAAISGSGLELLAVIPWYERALVPRLTPEVLNDVRREYPTATLDDLLATFVAVIARKPGGEAPGR